MRHWQPIDQLHSNQWVFSVTWTIEYCSYLESHGFVFKILIQMHPLSTDRAIWICVFDVHLNFYNSACLRPQVMKLEARLWWRTSPKGNIFTTVMPKLLCGHCLPQYNCKIASLWKVVDKIRTQVYTVLIFWLRNHLRDTLNSWSKLNL